MKGSGGNKVSYKETSEDYVSARDLHKEWGIWATTARMWRNQGKIRAEKFGATWYYSRQDLSRLLKSKYPIMIEGERAKLLDIRPWVRDSALKEALGDYISAKDVHYQIDIPYTTLRNWRKSGIVRAKKIGAIWYYSKHDILALIKSLR